MKRKRKNKKKSRRKFPSHLAIGLAKDKNPKERKYLSSHPDVTKYKKVLEEKDRLLKVIETCREAISIQDKDFKIIYTNPAFCRLYGYRKNELIGKHISIINAKKTSKNTVKTIIDSLIDKGWWRGEILNRKKDGTELLTYAAISVSKDENGKVVNCFSTQHDITEENMAQEKIMESEAKFKSIFDNVNIMIFGANSKGTLRYINETAEKALGYSQKEAIGMNIRFLHPPEERKEILKKFKAHVSGELKEDLELGYITKSGKRFIGSMVQTIFKDRAGKEWYFGLVQDITERKKAEKALEESEEKFKTLAEQSPNMIFINQGTAIVYANKKVEEIMGYKTEELYSSGFSYTKLLAPESIKLAKKAYAIHEAGKEVSPLEYKLLTKEGKVIHSIIATKMINYAGENAILGVVTDITERKNMEIALKESEKRFRKSIENMLDCFGIYSAMRNKAGHIVDFRIEYINSMGCKSNAMSKKDLLGKQILKVIPAYRNSILFEEYCKIVEKGEPFVADSMVFNDYYKGRKRQRVFDIRAVKVGDGFISTWRNVTEYMKMRESEKREAAEKAKAKAEREKARHLRIAYEQLKRAQEQLVQVGKLSAIGQLAAGLAHELNSPLTGLLGLIRVYRKEKVKNSTEYEDLSRMLEACEFMAKIVGDLNFFASPRKRKFTEVDLNHMVESTLSFASTHLKQKGIKVIKHYASDLPKIKAHKAQIQQVMLNIIANARDAMPNGGTFTINTRYSKNGKNVIAKFRDTGRGIKKSDLSRIFDPFFTTKKPGKGVGLGLSVSHGIVKSHRGTFKVESEKGNGTSFAIIFPALKA